ncbi:hypothetical protein K7432_014380 [Basidiobolus ranarum]|uniref:Uncharacterized protein n=1 Tax=Basidiobolus ranarum TaxID=34480 RepID=A0ABR2VPL3_9FUNG
MAYACRVHNPNLTFWIFKPITHLENDPLIRFDVEPVIKGYLEAQLLNKNHVAMGNKEAKTFSELVNQRDFFKTTNNAILDRLTEEVKNSK